MGNLDSSVANSRKDNNLANKLREEGNRLLNAKNYYKALVCIFFHLKHPVNLFLSIFQIKYNESLCNAEPSSEAMGYAYANRSVVYLSLTIHQYNNCIDKTKLAIENIKLAIANGYPIDKQGKLMERLKSCEMKILEESKKPPPMFEPEYEFKLSYEVNFDSAA